MNDDEETGRLSTRARLPRPDRSWFSEPTSSNAFAIGPVSAAPGTTASGSLAVAAGPGEPATTIPISILHGRTPGPVVVFVAGVHGMEYVPILALQRAAGVIDPASLGGTVVLVHTANMPSFLGRTIYYSPVDGKNLNRVFPRSSRRVALLERIAHVLTTEVVSRATHLVDLHGGDGNESLRPYSYWITTGAPTVAAESRALALAFGLDRIVVDRGRPTDPAASLYLSNTAITRGVLAITTEIGGLGQADEAALALAARGIAGVLRRTGLRDEGPAPVAHPRWVVKDEVLRAGTTGLFQASVDCGEVVEAGATIGRITDFQGRVLESIRAPFDGELLYVVRTPPVTKGEPLAMVGVLANQPD